MLCYTMLQLFKQPLRMLHRKTVDKHININSMGKSYQFNVTLKHKAVSSGALVAV